jgi:hypothetical protein
VNTNRPRPKPSASFEYFLYAAIIVETALAAFVYKIIFRDPDLARLRLYFAIFYFAFLAWSIAQLNSLHRRRKLAQAEQVPTESRAAASEPSRSALGLTTTQLVIVIVVFVGALATFSWALKLLR